MSGIRKSNDANWHKLAVHGSAFSAWRMSALEIFHLASIRLCMTALEKADVLPALARKTFGKSAWEEFTYQGLTEKRSTNTSHRISVYLRLVVLMGYCRRKLEAILGDTGGKFSTTTFYKSAALPTELRQPRSYRGMQNHPPSEGVRL
jgi:hypothetical protein